MFQMLLLTLSFVCFLLSGFLPAYWNRLISLGLAAFVLAALIAR